MLHVRNRRDREFDLIIFESNRPVEIVLTENDVVRFKVFENEKTPILDLSSLDPGQITFTAGTGECVVNLTASQIESLGAGAWDAEISVWVESEDKLKNTGSGVIFVHPTQTGQHAGEESSSSGSSENSSVSSF